MKVGSLFSGIGGFDLGLERNGFDIRWQCEIDTNAQTVLRRHWPDATLYDDVTTLGGDVERVDLICGGFPCQDLSVAGRRAGLAGERSGLFYEFMRIADECAPTWVLIENVPGLLSSNGGRDMGAVLGTLGDLGYGWAYRVLDAQYFGVAQRRRRVFIVGCLGNPARAAQVLFEPESCSGDTPPSREAGARTAASVIKGAAIGRKPEAGPQYGEVLEDGTCYTLNCTEQHAVAACLNSGGNNGGFRTEPGEGYPCVAFGINGVSGSLRSNPGSGFRSDGSNVEAVVSQGMAVRRLTPTECERLQGFPDGWTDGQADSARYRQLGNAVCVNVAEWIGHRIMAVAS